MIWLLVTRLQLTLYTALDRLDRGIEICLEYLRRGGTNWSTHPTSDEVQREYDRIWSLLGNRQIEDLIDLPLVTHPDILDVLEVLTEIVTPAVFFDKDLCALVICRMVNLSLEHGNSDASCFAYIWFGMIAGPRFGNYEAAFRFGQLGYDLLEKRGLKRYRSSRLHVLRKRCRPVDEDMHGTAREPDASSLRCRLPDGRLYICGI